MDGDKFSPYAAPIWVVVVFVTVGALVKIWGVLAQAWLYYVGDRSALIVELNSEREVLKKEIDGLKEEMQSLRDENTELARKGIDALKRHGELTIRIKQLEIVIHDMLSLIPDDKANEIKSRLGDSSE